MKVRVHAWRLSYLGRNNGSIHYVALLQLISNRGVCL